MFWVKYLFCHHRHDSKKLQWNSVKSSLSFFPPLQLKSVYFRWFDWNFWWFLMFFTLVLTEDDQTERTENLINFSDINHAHIKEEKPVGTNTQTSSVHHKLSIKLFKSQVRNINHNNNDDKIIIFASSSEHWCSVCNRDGLFLPTTQRYWH